ncbi:MMPL family transporter [Streptomyces radicis]|uniref:MMPL family transporter n=1 Tax=Streptomyces radicis TaxID=1750517 RepID=A0A3A9WBT4_9ACTN|nr:MMPL family transporter [Streptomyces radicis]RKN10229.1 MMPL family transporter [Streptomyces radicis]RKN24571.1 MMPL family transporter [Streptomyces radicis]
MLGTFARVATRRPLTVIGVWALLIVVGFGIGTGVFGRLIETVESVPGSESDRATATLDRIDPLDGSITAVIESDDVTDPALTAEVERALADVRALPDVSAVPDPIPSEDGRALLIPIEFARDDGDSLQNAVDVIRAIEDRADAEVNVSGGPLLGEEMGARAQEDVQRAELISLPVVLALLLVIFGGLRAAGLPLMVAVSGVAGAFLALHLFSLVTEVSVYAVQLTTMLGLGLAVDYALLMVVTFREERRATDDVVEAVTGTVRRAGRTVLFSGLTVAVSLAGLLVFPSPFLRSMGLAAAAVVVVDMLAALTLLPALLTRFGKKIAPAGPAADSGAFFARVARFAARRPLVVTAATVAPLVLLASPVAGLTMAVGDARSLPASTEARGLYDALEDHYPEGTGISPITVLMAPDADPDIAERVQSLPGVASASTTPLDDGAVIVRLTPAGEVDGPTATGLVEDIRALRGDELVEVTGPAARLVDFRAMLAERTPWAVAIVLVSIFVLLFAFTGSLLLPIRTILTTLLSLGAALGAVVLVFQDDLGALNITAPPLILAIAFGLAMDYELFILARMREAWLDSGDPHTAVVTGLRRSGRVVSCAALLLAVVFGAFMTGGFSPILQIGLGLTLAVLIDATLVRMLLVPATMTLLGRRAWWSPTPLRTLHTRYGLSEAPTTPSPSPTPAPTKAP